METAISSIPHDKIIFLGDMEEDIEIISRIYPNERICRVTGNNEYLFDAKYEIILREEGVSILCCHGHKYRVKQTLDPLYYAATQKNCQVALFGHTHRQYAETTESGLLLLNPGSVGSRGEYAVLTLKNGTAAYTLCRV